MELIKCIGCGNMVSSEAETCPKCGASMEQMTIEITPELRKPLESFEDIIFIFVRLKPVQKGGKWGYINKDGEEVIPCRYDYAEYFSGGFARVQKNGMWGYINENGEEILPCRYDDAEDFSEGFARVQKNGMWGYINENGEEILLCRYDDAEDFNEGFARVQKDGLWGLVNKKGEEIVPCRYDEVKPFSVFSRGFPWVQKDGLWGLVNEKGEEVLPCIYDTITEFCKGFVRVRQGDLWGLVNKDGEEVLSCRYDTITEVCKGFARVRQGDLWGFINRNGEEVIPCKYDGAGSFSKGLAVVKIAGKWGYVDKKGNSINMQDMIYVEDYTKSTFYNDPKLPDEYKLDCALSVLKYMVNNPELFTSNYYTVLRGVILYLNKLLVRNHNNQKTEWKEKADLYFKYFSVLREGRNEKALEAIGIDLSQLPKSKFGNYSEDEIAKVCAKEFIDKIEFSYIFEGKNIGIFR